MINVFKFIIIYVLISSGVEAEESVIRYNRSTMVDGTSLVFCLNDSDIDLLPKKFEDIAANTEGAVKAALLFLNQRKLDRELKLRSIRLVTTYNSSWLFEIEFYKITENGIYSPSIIVPVLPNGRVPFISHN